MTTKQRGEKDGCNVASKLATGQAARKPPLKGYTFMPRREYIVTYMHTQLDHHPSHTPTLQTATETKPRRLVNVASSLTSSLFLYRLCVFVSKLAITNICTMERSDSSYFLDELALLSADDKFRSSR